MDSALLSYRFPTQIPLNMLNTKPLGDIER